jgi:hypothetical protein
MTTLERPSSDGIANTEMRVPTGATAPQAVAVPEPDPGVVGLPAFIAGAIALALTLTGYVSATSTGAAIPLVLLASGLGQLIATFWAIKLGQTAVAGINFIFGSFWLSYAFLALGLTHSWFGVGRADIKHTEAMFLIAWVVVVAALTLATLTLPVAFTALFVLVELAFVLSLVGTLATSSTASHLAGYAVFAFVIVGLYLFVGAIRQATGGKPLPLGGPLQKS